jgi:hypothetical protein
MTRHIQAKQKKQSKRESVSAPAPLPLFSDFRVEVKQVSGGRKSVLVCDCEEILMYTHEAVAFRHRGVGVRIQGRELWCRTYGNRVAEVVGTVEQILFGEGKELCGN